MFDATVSTGPHMRVDEVDHSEEYGTRKLICTGGASDENHTDCERSIHPVRYRPRRQREANTVQQVHGNLGAIRARS